MAHALAVFNKGIDPDFTGGAADKGHAGKEDHPVGQKRAALKDQVVDGSGGDDVAGVPDRAGARHFVDPGDELSAEEPPCGVDVFIAEHIDVFHL